MTTLLVGGTFNPVHIGHLYLAEEAMNQFGYQRVLFIPANIPAHKENHDATTAEQRLEMLRRVLADSPFSADDSEIRRGGVSYMVETVEDLQSRYHITGKPGLIIGDDLVEGLSSWRNWEGLRRMVDLIIAHRSSYSRVTCPWEHRYLDNLIFPVSSSSLRKRIASDAAYRYLLPPAAYRYIREKRLYGFREHAG